MNKIIEEEFEEKEEENINEEYDQERTRQVIRPSFVNKRFESIIKPLGISYAYNLMYFAKLGYRRVRNNFDLFMACSGWEGTGKSNLINTLGFLMDDNYDLSRNVLYSPDIDEIKKKIEWRKIVAKGEKPSPEALPPYSFINVDEAIKVVFKLEQWSGLQRFLKKLFALARVENKIIAFCIPNFVDMGNNFRSRMNYWIDVYHRDDKLSYATIDIQSQNKYRSDKWNMSSNEKLYEKMVGTRKYADINPQHHLAICKKTQNFLIDVECPLLPKVLLDEYEALKLKYDYDDAIDAKKEDKAKKRLDWYRKRITKLLVALKRIKPSLTSLEIEKLTGIRDTTIRGLLQRAREVEKQDDN